MSDPTVAPVRTELDRAALDSLRATLPSDLGGVEPLGMLLQTVIYLALVAAVVYVVLRWGLPRLLGERRTGRGSLELLARLPLGGNRAICTVRAEGRTYLLGITDHEIRTLDIIEEEGAADGGRTDP